MKTRYLLVLLALFLFGCAAGGSSNGAPVAATNNETQNWGDTMLYRVPPNSGFDIASGVNITAPVRHLPVCPAASDGEARCHAHVVVDEFETPLASTGPSGYGPAQFRGGYGLSGTAAGVPIIGIVDAYDDPNILSDLNTYNSAFGLPAMTTCAASPWPPSAPCFRKVNQSGGSTPPTANSGWALEISLDVEMAHAICQNCVILLVEASSSSFGNLMAAVDRARLMGAKAISNSYGGSEFSGETSYDSHFNYPGIAFTVSSGDNGYGVEYPAASQYVTAVGGTTLTLSGNSWAAESAWSGAGSGCSRYDPQPSFQTALGLTGCTRRMVADVSADADPNTGAAVYDSVSYDGQKGWFQVGGTSLASPLVAAAYALGSIPSASKANSLPYSLGVYGTNLHDIVSGSNGACSPSYLCHGVAGYDGPTGLGSPLGTFAF
jgi:subtilase family serine protease